MSAYGNYRDDSRQQQRGGGDRYGGGDRKPNYPPPVTVPTPCDVTTNLYKYTGKDLILHQYVVTFTPEIQQKNVFSKFLQMAEKNNFKESYAFDGISILVSNKKFSDQKMTIPLRDGELVCKIEYKHTYDSSERKGDKTTLMQCMEVVFRYYQKLSFFVDKKKMFPLNSRAFDLGCGLEVLPGLISNFKLNRDGYYMNLDAVFGVFYKAVPLLDLLNQFNRDQRRNPLREDMGQDFYSNFERFIKNLKVVTTHRGEKNSAFKVSGMTNQSASSVEFEVDGKKWTVAEYFGKTYGPLKYPHLPLVVIKKKDNVIHLPLEVLALTPMQKYSRKLDDNQTSQMITIAAKRPRDRFALISEKAKDLCALQNDNLNKFGMAFDNSMLNCKGVILPAPKISFSNKTMDVNNGGWNLIGCKALAGVKIHDWTIFTFRSNCIVPDSSIDTFVRFAANYGVEFVGRVNTICVSSVREFCDAKKSAFNLVVLPDKSSQRYEEVKRIAETYQSCVTQCIVASNIVKLTNPSFISNLLLKINAKLGGKNWSIGKQILHDKPTIVIGIDVSHPGAGDIESPSLISIVGSLDYQFVNYKTIIEQQERRQEIIGGLKDHIKSLLKAHFGATKNKPARLLIFRDGVGDSMFDAVYKTEIEAIQAGCHELDANYNPEINFVVAQKRHSIRFSSNGNNLVPGTVVDEIGNPDVFDFFLVSQNALQGTARPVRYIVVRNDSKIEKMDMYDLVFNLCHLYARATKSVSVVPPIYYADLGAARGKCYLEKNAEGVVVMRSCSKEISKNLFYV